jgi:tetratricopeptide (TPR) repeat protein
VTGCLTDALLLGLIEDTLDAEARRRALAHVDGCPACRELMAAAAPAILDLGRTASPVVDTGDGLVRGMTVGRYLVMDLVGAGAMGEVHSAYDPQLDRRIALKILRGSPEPGLVGRLLREAQTMARLSHPNVVSVYDAGTFAERVFVAMEFVEGQTLKAWLRARARPWREVVAAFLAAGRGLAAAHALGIVHRDFKPDNVLVAKDGRVRVADFGLARLGDAGDAAHPAPSTPASGMTRTGAVVGTPAYMSPEQIEGRPATAASDQFSFCVALHEGLFGARPFLGHDLGELLQSQRRGPQPHEVAAAAIPLAIRRALRRGLRLDPAERFVSMDALLAALEKDPVAARRRALGALVAVGTAATVGLVALRGVGGRPPPCRGAEAEAAAVWSPQRRAAVEQALVGTGLSYAPVVAATFSRIVDGYAAGWAAARIEACEATQVQGTQSAELLDLRMRCLHRELQELGALVDEFARPDRDLVERAVNEAYKLPPLARCSADAVLSSRVAPPRDGPAVERLQGVLARVRAFIAAGRYEPALEVAHVAVAAARALDYAPIEADAELALAGGQAERSRLDDAIASYQRAIDAALAAGDDGTAARAFAGRVVALVMRTRREEARETVRQGMRLAERLGDATTVADLLHADGRLRYNEGDYAGARARADRCYDMRVEIHGADHPDVAEALRGRGLANRMLGRLAEARADLERALAIKERLLGPAHPGLASELNGLANVLLEDIGDYEAARRLYERARVIVAARGPDSGELGMILVNLGFAHAQLGELREGLTLVDEGVVLLDTGWGRDHPNSAYSHVVRAQILTAVGRFDDALAEHDLALDVRRRIAPEQFDVASSLTERALTLARAGRVAEAERDATAAVALAARTVGPDHPGTGTAHYARCRVLLDAKKPAAALPDCTAALAIAERAFGPSHPEVARAQVAVGEAELATGDAPAARAALERAVAYFDAHAGNLDVRARARSALARARSAL